MELKNYHCIKSFFVMARNHTDCYKCPYCILSSKKHLCDETLEKILPYDNSITPTELHPVLKNIPVSINNYFGDPFLQYGDTLKKLESLESQNHKGIVCIITKSPISRDKLDRLKDFDIDLHILYSICNTESFDGPSYSKRINTLQRIIESGINASLEFRPFINGVNDSIENINTILEDVKEIGVKNLAYAGLMGAKEVLSMLELKGFSPKVPRGYSSWSPNKKLMNKDTRIFLEKRCRELGLNSFRKTSCLLSHSHGLERDYNNHFYRPQDYSCDSCPMHDKCFTFRNELKEESILDVMKEIKIKNYELERQSNIVCGLYESCTSKSDSCKNMKGLVLKLETMTSGDESLLKWLTGCIVKSDKLLEIPNVSIL